MGRRLTARPGGQIDRAAGLPGGGAAACRAVVEDGQRGVDAGVLSRERDIERLLEANARVLAAVAGT